MTWHDDPPAEPDHLQALIANAAPLHLPPQYLAFLTAADGGEGDLTVPGCSTWLQVWSAGGVVSSNQAYAIADRFRGLFAIGSNGGGELFAFDTRNSTGPQFPIVMLPAIGIDWDDLVAIAPDWDSFELCFGLEDPSIP
jgi:hypothetical protein